MGILALLLYIAFVALCTVYAAMVLTAIVLLGCAYIAATDEDCID
jgi:hypothetical protein